jgi:large subunit ribosomal protein L2
VSRTPRCSSRRFQKAGRNNNGHITTRHKGGGHKHHYRVVDFKRNKDGIPAKVERIEYDPNRTAHIALVCYADGERRYIIAPRGLEGGRNADERLRSADPRRQHAADPQHPGRFDHPLHRAASRARVRRSRARQGTSVTLLAREGTYAQVRCVRVKSARCTSSAAPPSAKWPTKSTACANSARPVPSAGWASARRSRGVAMNPVDHPHGGGEGRTGEGRHVSIRGAT